MSNVLIEKNKIDILANAISDKSGVPVTMTLDEMVEAVDGIETGGGGVTPTGNIDITEAGVTDVTEYATATVPQGEINVSADTSFYTQNNVYRWHFQPFANIKTSDYAGKVGFLADNYYKAGNNQIFSAIASGTSVTPTETAQSIGGTEYMMAGAVTVNAIPSTYVGSGIAQRSASDLTASGATVTVPSGYYSAQASKAVTSGSASPASTISATGATLTTGTNTLTLSKSVSNTPTVSEGYISSGTSGNSSVSLTASVTTQGAQTIYPSSSDQTINSGRYLTGNQTIKGVTTTNLTADNIKNGVTVTVGDSADADRVLSVTGTYIGGGGSSMNVQVAQSTSRATSSTYTNVISLTCSTAGKYDIYWDCFRSSTGGTNGSQLYIGGQAYGTANTVFTNHAQTNHLTNVTLQANQSVAVYARSRGSNYYAYVGTLVIKQSS